jgi:hypothetical protein
MEALSTPVARTVAEATQWAKAMFATIDAKDTEAFLAYLAHDARFVYGSFPPAIGGEAMRATLNAFFGSVDSLSHALEAVWVWPGIVICTGTVRYVRLDTRVVTLPFCDVLKLSGEKVRDYAVYVDPAPLMAP